MFGVGEELKLINRQLGLIFVGPSTVVQKSCLKACALAPACPESQTQEPLCVGWNLSPFEAYNHVQPALQK